MKQEYKELILKDLCARLPYHPIVYVDENLPRLKLGAATRIWEYIAVDKPCKPYLRPMSSMTKEERKYFQKLAFPYDFVDALNANYFDYRGLIEKDLALEAPKNMYDLNK